ncbi:MAG: YsnF/AvaK domain-containing protein, partial [Actinomycetota bacterium]|nr:YsnF/AvaK domain-containing protein [Actinomycetota bacterium]
QRSEEELRAGTRERRAGSVNVRKRVRTDHERLSVPKRREEVSVERVPVEDREASEAEIVEDDEVRIPVVEEEVVVEKRPVVKEEIRLRKAVVEEEEVVEADLRKEEVKVDRIERGEGSRRARTVDQETADRLPKETRDETSLEDGGKVDRKPRRQERSSKKDHQRAVNADDTKEDQESLPVAEYNYLTVEEAKRRLTGLSEGELKKLRTYEKKHKNRKTLVRWLDRKLNKVH